MNELNSADWFAALKEKPWPSERPKEFDKLITMLKGGELAMLQYLTSTYYSGLGSIIDAGSFVGGSTVALASGLRNSRKPGVIHSYDRFIAPPKSTTMNRMIGVQEGESFRGVYDRQVEPYKDLVRTYEGDFQLQPIPNGPIEILFIDLAKGGALNDFLLSELFPRLIPNRSIVVHQDYLYYGLPWIPVTMESLADNFVILCDEANSVVFGCSEQVTFEKAREASWTLMPTARRLELMDRVIDRWSGRAREFLETTRSTFKF